MKEFEVPYNDVKVKIKIDDKPLAGICMKIADLAVEHKGNQMIPKTGEFFIALGTNLIKEAPWQLNSPDALRALPQETYEELCNIFGDLFSLERFLYPGIKLTYGKKLETVVFPSQTESITFSPNGELPSAK